MFALLKKSKELDLPIDLQLELFDSLTLPIMLYGCEVWGYENVLISDRLYLKYLKYVLGLKQSTLSCMVYGETGRFPLSVYIKTRMISFWCKLVSDDENKLSSRLYNLICHYSDNRTLSYKWLDIIKHILDHTGFSNMFVMPRNNIGNLSNFHMVIKKRLEYQFEQQWRDESSKCTLYRIFKTEFKYEKYLYHCTEEKHFVNLKPVTTSYLLKSDFIQTHQELIEYVFFVITTHYVIIFILF